MGNFSVVLRKAKSSTYNFQDIKEVEGQDVSWIRAMTLKEVSKKLDNPSVKACVLEDVTEDEHDIARDIVLKSGENVKVIFVGGKLTIGGAVNAANTEEVRSLLGRLVKGEDISQTEGNKIEDDFSFEAKVEDYAGLETVEDLGVDLDKYQKMLADRNKYKSLYENYKAELQNLKDKMDNLMVDDKVAEFMSSGIDVGDLQRELQQSKSEVERLKKQVTDLGAEKSEHRTTRQQLEATEAELAREQTRRLIDIESLDILRKNICYLGIYGTELMETIAGFKEKLSVKGELVKDAKANSENLQKELEKSLNQIKDIQAENDRLLREIEEIKEANEAISLDVVTISKDRDGVRGELADARNTINKLNQEKEKLLDDMEQQKREISEYQSYDIDRMKDNLLQGDELAKEFNRELEKAKRQHDADSVIIEDLKQKLALYSENANRATNKYLARERYINGDTTGAVDVECQGRAQLIAVFGSGGKGITSVATAIAERLSTDGANTVVVDMDFRSPKMEACYNVKPFIDNIPGCNEKFGPKEFLRKTSVGALVKLGAAVWTEDEVTNALAFEINAKRKGREGRLTYHPGSYYNLAPTEIAGAEWSAMLSKLAIEYDFIVLDMGTLEGFGPICNLQLGVNRIANKSFMVTSGLEADIRNAFLKIENAKFVTNKMCWVINMDRDGKLSKQQERMLRDIPNVTSIPFVNSMFGSGFPLAENNNTKLAIKELVSFFS